MELKRDGTVKTTELIQTDNHQTLHRDGSIEFNEFNETAIDGQIVTIKRSGEITSKEFQENIEEIKIMAGLYYNAVEDTWKFKKDDLTPEYNPDVSLYLMIETKGRSGFTVSRGAFAEVGSPRIENTEMFVNIDDVLNNTIESLDVTDLVNRQIQRKDFVQGNHREGRCVGIWYNVEPDAVFKATPIENYILGDRESRGRPKNSQKSKGHFYSKMRFIIGYFEGNDSETGKHKKYQWGDVGQYGPDVGVVFKLYYKLNTDKPNTRNVDILKRRIIINK